MDVQKDIPQLVHDARSALGVIQTTAELGLMESDQSKLDTESLTRIIEQVVELSSILSQISEAHSPK